MPASHSGWHFKERWQFIAIEKYKTETGAFSTKSFLSEMVKSGRCPQDVANFCPRSAVTPYNEGDENNYFARKENEAL